MAKVQFKNRKETTKLIFVPSLTGTKDVTIRELRIRDKNELGQLDVNSHGLVCRDGHIEHGRDINAVIRGHEDALVFYVACTATSEMTREQQVAIDKFICHCLNFFPKIKTINILGEILYH